MTFANYAEKTKNIRSAVFPDLRRRYPLAEAVESLRLELVRMNELSNAAYNELGIYTNDELPAVLDRWLTAIMRSRPLDKAVTVAG